MDPGLQRTKAQPMKELVRKFVIARRARLYCFVRPSHIYFLQPSDQTLEHYSHEQGSGLSNVPRPRFVPNGDGREQGISKRMFSDLSGMAVFWNEMVGGCVWRKAVQTSFGWWPICGRDAVHLLDREAGSRKSL